MRTDRGTPTRIAVLALMAGTLLAAGCTYTVVPKHVPYSTGVTGMTLAEASVLIINAEKAMGDSPILTERGGRSGLLADRQVWTRKLVEVLAAELARRGARVLSGAPVKLGLSIPAITFTETRAVYQVSVKVAVSSSAGWSKEYEGSAQEKKYRVVSATAEADRLSGLALSDAVRTMLADPELPGRLKPPAGN